MGLNFRRRQKLFPGVYLNFSSKGVSTTIGVKGVSVNVGKDGTYLNTSIPGTGIYSRSKLSDNTTSENKQNSSSYSEEPFYFFPKKLEGEIKSSDANSVTSEGLAEMKETLLAAYQEKLEIQKEILKVEEEIKKAASNKLLSQIFIIGFFTSKFKDLHSEKIDYLKDLKQQLNECKVNIDINIDNNIKEKYDAIKLAFSNLSKSTKIWDKTSAVKNNESRSAAGNAISRTLTSLSYKKIEFINADFDALYFKNQNGSDIFIYPAFAVLFDNKNNFGLVDLSELQISFKLTKFLEEEGIPNDSKIIGESWAKINKDGTPDKRFKGNYQIPIVEYAEIEFKSNSGIYEVFMISNTSFANDFVEKYNNYLS
jgi:hypothetical protein